VNIIQSGRRKIVALPMEELMALREMCYYLQWHPGVGSPEAWARLLGLPLEG
jgi:hypothetical protein